MNNRELIKKLLVLDDETLKEIGRPGMAGEGRKAAKHYADGGDVKFYGTYHAEHKFSHPSRYYTIIRKTIRVNGIEVPEPELEELEEGQMYYVANIVDDDYCYSLQWDGHGVDIRLLKRGLIHLDKESAIKHAKAMLKFEEAE